MALKVPQTTFVIWILSNLQQLAGWDPQMQKEILFNLSWPALTRSHSKQALAQRGRDPEIRRAGCEYRARCAAHGLCFFVLSLGRRTERNWRELLEGVRLVVRVSGVGCGGGEFDRGGWLRGGCCCSCYLLYVEDFGDLCK